MERLIHVSRGRTKMAEVGQLENDGRAGFLALDLQHHLMRRRLLKQRRQRNLKRRSRVRDDRCAGIRDFVWKKGLCLE